MSSTLRQKIAVQKLSEIIGNSKGQKHISMGRILREAGYSEETSKTPQLVTESKGFKEEMERFIPDEMIVKTHRILFEATNLTKMTFDSSLSDRQIKSIVEGLEGNKIRNIVRPKRGNQVICYYSAPDGNTRLKAIDMGYKIKNLYHRKGEDNNKPITVHVINYGDSHTS